MNKKTYPCPDCGGDLASSARICPHCGRRKHAVVRTPAGRLSGLTTSLGAILILTLFVDFGIFYVEGVWEFFATKIVFIDSLIFLGWWNVLLVALALGYIYQD